jgi:ubiquinone/menaquinone biosynthesis C-methylase UbiE
LVAFPRWSNPDDPKQTALHFSKPLPPVVHWERGLISTATNPSIAGYWHRDDLVNTVLAALGDAGKSLDALTVDDLAASDQFHGGGRAATLRLAELAGLDQIAGRPFLVLDVGGGLGGPARTLAHLYGCEVVSLDLTESYIQAARRFTELVGIGDRVTHSIGDALDLPFEDHSFDLVWTQNSGMNIADKAALFEGFRRVLRPGGKLAFQEPTAGSVSPPHYPLMWADDASSSFLWTQEELRALVVSLGFQLVAWHDVTETLTSASGPPPPDHAVQVLIMGRDRLDRIQAAQRRNVAEGRAGMVQAVFVLP